MRRGWCSGSVEFKRQMLERMDCQLGEHHAGNLHRQAGEAPAERIIAEELRGFGWMESQSAGQPTVVRTLEEGLDSEPLVEHVEEYHFNCPNTETLTGIVPNKRCQQLPPKRCGTKHQIVGSTLIAGAGAAISKPTPLKTNTAACSTPPAGIAALYVASKIQCLESERSR